MIPAPDCPESRHVKPVPVLGVMPLTVERVINLAAPRVNGRLGQFPLVE